MYNAQKHNPPNDQGDNEDDWGFVEMFFGVKGQLLWAAVAAHVSYTQMWIFGI
jgi:hypothetical protein